MVIVPVTDPADGTTLQVFADVESWLRAYLRDADGPTLEFLARFVADLNAESARLTATLTERSDTVSPRAR